MNKYITSSIEEFIQPGKSVDERYQLFSIRLSLQLYVTLVVFWICFSWQSSIEELLLDANSNRHFWHLMLILLIVSKIKYVYLTDTKTI